MMVSPFPLVQLNQSPAVLKDGAMLEACAFCKHAMTRKVECNAHYKDLANKPDGYYQCPFGFTTRTFSSLENRWAVTGVVAFPRFDTNDEKARAKSFPKCKVARQAIEEYVTFLRSLETLRADVIQKAAEVLPQAMHELRKLNGAILQRAEQEIRSKSTPGLISIQSAAELVRNNYDILEALANIDGMKAIPRDSTINLFDLCYKARSIYLEKASSRNIMLYVNGVRALINGSQKSFPIVPAALIENAIKYGVVRSEINVQINGANGNAYIEVTNETDHVIDPQKCFERGTRYASNAVEGKGFGLYLVKEIVRAHGGNIQCKQNGRFVTMTVELPLIKVIP